MYRPSQYCNGCCYLNIDYISEQSGRETPIAAMIPLIPERTIVMFTAVHRCSRAFNLES
jgi:hypothetical protein